MSSYGDKSGRVKGEVEYAISHRARYPLGYDYEGIFHQLYRVSGKR